VSFFCFSGTASPYIFTDTSISFKIKNKTLGKTNVKEKRRSENICILLIHLRNELKDDLALDVGVLDELKHLIQRGGL
jgi:hypothetical protein